MYSVLRFISWALTHINVNTIPKSAKLLIPNNECGAEPWHYLYGSTKVATNADTLDRYYKNHYYKTYTRAEYDAITKNWKPDEWATDCQGLLDAYLTYEENEPIDWNADMNYKYMCEDKGTVQAITRDYVIGEAVFMQNSTSGKMTHIGWVCGFLPSGEPVVVEARGVKFGVIVTAFNGRGWTHRGLMTKKFEYPELVEKPVIFEVTKPVMQGDFVIEMQKALNSAGYTDTNGNVLEVDGKWGIKSQEAFNKLLLAHKPVDSTPQPIINPIIPIITFKSADGRITYGISELKIET